MPRLAPYACINLRNTFPSPSVELGANPQTEANLPDGGPSDTGGAGFSKLSDLGSIGPFPRKKWGKSDRSCT